MTKGPAAGHCAGAGLSHHGDHRMASDDTIHQHDARMGRRRWLVVVLLSCLLVTNFVERVNFTVAGPLVIRDLGLSAAEFGILLFAFQASYAVFNLIAGPVVDRIGPRTTLAVAASLWSSFALLTGVVRSFAGLLIVRTGLGIADSPMYPAMIKAINNWFPDRERGTAISICQACFYAATGISAPLITLLMITFGWPEMFLIVGAIGLVPVLAWIVLYREPDQDRRLSAAEYRYIVAGQANRADDAAVARHLSLGEWLGLFRHGGVWIMLAAGFFLQFAMGFYLWVPVYLEQARGVSIVQAGLLTAVPYLGGAIGELLGGQISDRLIRAGRSPLDARRWTIAGGAMLTALAMAAMPSADGLAPAIMLLALGMFAGGIGNGSFWILATVISDSPRLVGSLASVQSFGGLIALAVAPLCAGFVVQLTGSFNFVFILSASCSAIAAAIYLLAMRRRLSL
jgi:sugar phosphate permease